MINSVSIKTLVVTGYGINCEEEVSVCFNQVGSITRIIHINELIREPKLLADYDILSLPGGFSYGDHIACGKNFSNKIRFNIFSEFSDFVSSGKPVIGICNGYQILVKLGIIPDLSKSSVPEFTFTHNTDGGLDNQERGHAHFVDRWVRLAVNKNNSSFWLKDLDKLELPVRHGEGRLVCPNQQVLNELKDAEQIAFYYADKNYEATMAYPDNPNGSVAGIAALTNKAGNVLGIMPHPEAYSLRAHYPNFLGFNDPVHTNIVKSHPLFSSSNKSDGEDEKKKLGVGILFFYNAVKYVREKKSLVKVYS